MGPGFSPDPIFLKSVILGRRSKHLYSQRLGGALLCFGAAGLIVQNVPQHQHLGHIQHRHLDGDAAGVQRTFLCAAQQHDVCQLCAGGVLVVGVLLAAN